MCAGGFVGRWGVIHVSQCIKLSWKDVVSLMATYTGQGDQEGMRKTKFCSESNPGLMTSKPAHQTPSHDHQTSLSLIPFYNCSGRCLTGNLTLQITQIMCRQNPLGIDH